jgi:hypothetical protein
LNLRSKSPTADEAMSVSNSFVIPKDKPHPWKKVWEKPIKRGETCFRL